ncbi:tail domain-containing protein [Pseudoalteromonas phage TW1]|uniref:central tail fiber J n=1 Tax=Pseudoalteromonas phage TW1 TaxID=1366055 RepID=UPI00035AB555|nr:central tail fiber J [Pseudoalteromonas phage TW1]AGR46534.1 tail domain-containing protein [Pseudoalteromonas phage TW1]
MPKLIKQDNLKLQKPKVIIIDSDTRIIDALKDNFEYLPPESTRILLNDELILHTDVAKLKSKLSDDDILTAYHEVKGFFAGVAEGVLGVSRDVLGFAVESLIDIPELDTQTQGSPNNQYQSQTNVAQLFAQKPVVCGSPVNYPYLANKPLETYVNNEKESENTFIVGFGSVTGGVVRAGETSINSGGFNATVNRYLPSAGVTTIPNYRVGQKVGAVSGQTIRGINQGTIVTSYTLTQGGTASTYVAQRFTAYVTQNASSDQLKSDFDAGGLPEIKLTYTIETTDPQGFPDLVEVSGTGSITSITLNASEYEIIIDGFNGDYSQGAYIVSGIDTIISSGIGPFSCPTQCEKLFFNIIFEKGLKGTADIRVVVYQLDAQDGDQTGVTETFNVSYTEDSPNDAIRRTFECTIANGRDWYEFECYRTNAESQDTQNPDVPTLENVFCVKELGNTNFQNLTMMQVTMRSGKSVGSGRGVDNKINIKGAQTEKPSYDVNTQTITANAPSRKCADAVLFIWRDFLERDPALLDLDELYAIQNRLDAINPELAQFDYTFDDVEMSAIERINLILNVMRVQTYYDGQKYRFWRDEAVTNENLCTLVSKADFADDDERTYTLKRSNYVNGQFDGVQVEYIDRSINKKAYIYKSFDGFGIDDTPSSNPKKITLTGCQSEINANNRAELEVRKLLFGRWSLTDTFTDSQSALSRGDVIRYQEVYEGGGCFGGEIESIDSNTATVLDDLTLDPQKTYNLYYTNLLGDTVGPQTVTAFTLHTFTVADLSQVYLAGVDGRQMGSRYFITEVNDTVQRLWRVTDIAADNYNVQVSAIGYDARVYDGDII